MHEERYEESAKLNGQGRRIAQTAANVLRCGNGRFRYSVDDQRRRRARCLFSWRAGVLQLQKYMNSELFRRRAPRCNDMHYTMKDMPCSKGRTAGTFGR